MKICKLFQALAFGLVALAAASCANAPIYNVDRHPVPVAAQRMSLAEIEKTIIEAGASRGWRFDRLGPGSLRATQRDPKGFEAIVDVKFDQTSYSITKNSTFRLREKDGTVHPHYNLWIRNLEKDIEDRLYAAGLART